VKLLEEEFKTRLDISIEIQILIISILSTLQTLSFLCMIHIISKK